MEQQEQHVQILTPSFIPICVEKSTCRRMDYPDHAHFRPLRQQIVYGKCTSCLEREGTLGGLRGGFSVYVIRYCELDVRL